MNNLKKIASLSLVLLAVLFNNPSPSAGATIFSDGFESGSFSAWTSSGGVWDVENGGTHSGSKKAEAKGDTGENDDLLQKSVSTVGSQNIVLSYWYKIAAGLESGDHIRVAWSVDGTVWNQVADYSSINTTNNYVKATHTLPAGANNNAGFRIRFSADLNSNSDQVWLDDVEITGEAIPTKGTLVINKVVVNDNGSTSTASDFSFSVNSEPAVQFENDGSNSLEINPGNYSIAEVNIPSNYNVSYSADCSGTVTAGQTKSCTITNNDKVDMCPNIQGLQESVPEGYKSINTDDQTRCVPQFVDVKLCKVDDSESPRGLSGWTVKLDGAGENDYQGVTGRDGCYTFDNIPYGNYIAGEVMKEGWTQVALPNENGTIQAYNLENGPYYIVNHRGNDDDQICNPEVNLIKNGGFETPAISSGTYNLFAQGAEGLEWLLDWVTQSENTPKLEIQNNVAGSPFSGSQHTELDGDAPVKIWQNIETIPGKTYTLNFHYSPRPGVATEDNSIEVKINDIVSGSTLSGDGSSLSDTSWNLGSRTFVATGTSTKIEFSDAGTSNSFGGYLDDVSLYCQNTQEPTDGHVTIYKYTTGGDGTFSFSGINEGFSLTTTEGTAVSEKFALPASEEGTSYTVTENVPEGWTLTNSFCFKNSDLVVGRPVSSEENKVGNTTFSLRPEDDYSCAFFNLKDSGEQTSTITVNKVVVGSEMPASEFQLFVGETQVTSGQTNTFSPEEYTVREESKPNFMPSFSGACVATEENQLLLNKVEDFLAKKFALEDTIAENPNDEGNPEKQNLISDLDAKMVAILNTISADVNLGSGQNAVCTITNTYISNPDDNNTPPTITLVGSSDMSIINGSSFVDPGATAQDAEDGDITAFVVTSGSVNTSVNGDYTITYTVTDSGGLSASVSRVVRVVNQIPTGGGGGSITPTGNGSGGNTGGEVLGATTSCGLYLEDFLRYGRKNNEEQVKKLQTFLNDYLKLDPKINVNGIFGLDTKKAVIKFQEQESDFILKPWVGVTLKNTKKGTGWVYKTTITRINNIMCPELKLPIPEAKID